LNWLEITVQADGEAAEAVAELFNRYGRGGAVIEIPVDLFEHEAEAGPLPSTVLVKTYLPPDDTAGDLRRRIEEGLWHLGRLYPLAEPAVRELAEADWAEAWKSHYHLLRVGRRLVIVPAWQAYETAPGEVAVRLEPGMAFGTGLHPTTRLCLEAIEAHLPPGGTLLDVGTGSGVLAIAAALLGASSVLALDADIVSVRVAGENVALNGVGDRVSVRHASLPGGGEVPLHFSPDGPLELLVEGTFDLVAANILAPVIGGMAASLAARLAPGGTLVAAGLIEPQEAVVVDAFRAQGLDILERRQEKDWVCLVAAPAQRRVLQQGG
jgi:ribosomal protein L11 methyltransferase